MQNKLFYSAVLAMGVIALSASAAPADLGDANIHTIAHLYSFGTDGTGAELADCMITSTDYDAFFTELSSSYGSNKYTHLQSYSSYPSVKQLLLSKQSDNVQSAELFIQACVITMASLTNTTSWWNND